jgi:hypothetical protein
MKKFSELFSLNAQDFFKGLIVAIGGAVFAVIQSSLTASTFTLDWTNIWHIALGAGLSYLGKQFFTGTPTAIEVDSSKTTIIEKSVP